MTKDELIKIGQDWEKAADFLEAHRQELVRRNHKGYPTLKSIDENGVTFDVWCCGNFDNDTWEWKELGIEEEH